MGRMHTPKCHLAFKRKEVLTPVTTQMDPGASVLNETSQSLKATYCAIPPTGGPTVRFRDRRREGAGAGEGWGC